MLYTKTDIILAVIGYNTLIIDIILSFKLKTPQEIATDIAQRMRDKRLYLNWSQQTLAEHAGVSHGTLKRFEHTGQISLASLLKLALTLKALDGFEALFAPEETPTSLDAILQKQPRQRGRK